MKHQKELSFMQPEEIRAEVVYTTMFNYSGEDFEVLEKKYIYDQENELKTYTLFIEYHMGSEKLEDIVGWYKDFNSVFLVYLLKNYPEKKVSSLTGNVYKLRELAVDFEHECYWVDAGISEQYEIWDLYYYLEDVIKQLEGVDQMIRIQKDEDRKASTNNNSYKKCNISDLYNSTEGCDGNIVSGDNYSGIKCDKCRGWFCY